MKCVVVMPSYWGREKGEFREGDEVYDHPTPLDEEGTILKTLKSIDVLDDKDFELLILGCATSKEIKQEVEEKLKNLLKKAKIGVKTTFFSHSHLEKLKQIFKEKGQKTELLSLRGYSNIRNMCILVPNLMCADIVVLIDDDEVFVRPDFIKEIKQTVSKELPAITGYLTYDGEYLMKQKNYPWRVHWNKVDKMNETWKKAVEEPKTKLTSYLLGGDTAMHKSLFTKIPFDPNVTRGEDMDYLMNAMMFGYKAFSDNKLEMDHQQPISKKPAWLILRKDITRFAYQYRKLKTQEDMPGMTKITPEMLLPYPGFFLQEDLKDKLIKANEALIEYYERHEIPEKLNEAIKNREIIEQSFSNNFNPFKHIVKLQKQWEELMKFAETIRQEFSKIC